MVLAEVLVGIVRDNPKVNRFASEQVVRKPKLAIAKSTVDCVVPALRVVMHAIQGTI